MQYHAWPSSWPLHVREQLDALAIFEDAAIRDGDVALADSYRERYDHIVAEFDLTFRPRQIKAMGQHP